MNVLIVHWHPEPRSFCTAMAKTAGAALAADGHDVRTSDLHQMRFDPVSGRRNFTTVADAAYFKPQAEERHASAAGGFAADLEAEIQKVERCDLMIWQFPLWWFSVPAALKGWIDRVFAMGRIYGGGRIYETGMLRGKRAMLSLTTGGAQPSYEREGTHGDMAGVLRPIHRGMLQFVGFDVLAPHVVYGPVRLTDDQRRAELDRWAARLHGVCGELPIDVGPY